MIIDLEALKIKAVLADFDESVQNGYLSMRYGTIPHISIPDSKDENSGCAWFEIDKSTICRCTGIKIPPGQYLYEFDLCEFEDPFLRGEIRMGYIDFNDFTSSWVMRVSADTTLNRALKVCLCIHVVGNVVLYENDLSRLVQHELERSRNPAALAGDPSAKHNTVFDGGVRPLKEDIWAKQ